MVWELERISMARVGRKGVGEGGRRGVREEGASDLACLWWRGNN